MEKIYDAVVVGLGAMGSAASYQLAKRGASVLGIDRFSPPHTLGSTHGETRITRTAIGEGQFYVPFALRSHEIWRELEQQTGMQLLTQCGGVFIGGENTKVAHGVPHFFEQTVEAAKRFGIPHELLSHGQMAERFPQFHLAPDEHAYYEPGAGYVCPERCIEAQLRVAEESGAVLRKMERVLSITSGRNGMEVETDQERYEAKKVILTAGPWIREMLPEFAEHFRVFRQVMFWFAPKEGEAESLAPGKFPIFIWDGSDMYGFPAVDPAEPALKIACEDYQVTTSPDDVNRTASEEEIRVMYDTHVHEEFPGISDRCVRTAVCLYTVTPDSHFVIDTHPKQKDLIIASPCSGHGFKHSAAIGETLAELALDGKSTRDISHFSLSRFTA